MIVESSSSVVRQYFRDAGQRIRSCVNVLRGGDTFVSIFVMFQYSVYVILDSFVLLLQLRFGLLCVNEG